VIRRSVSPWEMTAAIEPFPGEDFGGKGLDYFYRLWRDSLQSSARKAIPVAGPTQTSLVWQKGRINQQPRSASAGGPRGWLSGNNDDSYRTDLVVERKGVAGPPLILKHAETSWDFSTDGAYVYFVKSYDPGPQGSYLNELYRCAIATGRVEQLTRGGRIYACAVSPNDREVAVVRFRDGRFTLEIFDVAGRTFRVIDPGIPGNSIIALDFNPADPADLIAERNVEGRSALYRIDRKSGTWVRITSGSAQEETPCFARDGRIYFSADYDGIFNIYSVRADGSDLLRHTSVVGGAFEPALEADGNTLLFSEYTSKGFRIVQAARAGESYTAPERSQCYFKPLTGGVAPQPMPYKIRMLRATWESAMGIDVFNDADGLSALQAGASVLRSESDALDRFSYFLGAGMGGDAGMNADVKSFMSTGGHGLFGGHSCRYDRFGAAIDSAAGSMRRPFLQGVTPALLTPRETFGGNPRLNATGSGGAPLIVVAPQCGVVMKNLAPTISSQASLNTVNLLPVTLNSESDIALQTGRGSTIGATFLADVVLIKLLTGYLGKSDTAMKRVDDSLRIPGAAAALPLWFNWQSEGYYNQDIGHNFNDVWQADLSVTPSDMMGRKDSVGDSLFPVPGISGRLDCMHGFPVTKYSGIPVALSADFSRYAVPVNATTLDSFPLSGNADLYVRSQAMVSFNFPIVRTIESGRRHFYDALYGKIGYFFTATANRSFLTQLQNSGSGWAPVFRRNSDEPEARRGFRASHLIFFTVEVNTVSEFLFSGEMSCTAVFDVVNGRSNVSIVSQF
jgi:hypothetical protein